MKEVQKKDVPEVSGGRIFDYSDPLPAVIVPYPQCPIAPGEPPDPLDPLGDAKKRPVQS